MELLRLNKNNMKVLITLTEEQVYHLKLIAMASKRSRANQIGICIDSFINGYYGGNVPKLKK